MCETESCESVREGERGKQGEKEIDREKVDCAASSDMAEGGWKQDTPGSLAAAVAQARSDEDRWKAQFGATTGDAGARAAVKAARPAVREAAERAVQVSLSLHRSHPAWYSN